jgi:Flp pilus assembly protein TadG
MLFINPALVRWTAYPFSKGHFYKVGAEATMKQIRLSFLRDERGVAAPIIALALTSLISATGASVDYARAQMVQTKLADTLDAAGLAAGATLSSQEPTEVAQNYFDVNFPQGYMDAQLAPLSVQENSTHTQLTLSASATIPTVFMGIVGIDTMNVDATSEITRKTGGLELTLVLDNTGSMAGSKLTSLKSASSELVNILFGENETEEKLFIGVVPFSQAVNVGPSHTSWLNSNPSSLFWGPASWAGCVENSATEALDTDDTPPPTQRWPVYYWADDDNNDWRRNNGQARSGLGNALGPNKGCPQEVLRMTNVKADILGSLNTMQAVGNTHVNVGAVWGWRMLSPRWRGLWGGTMDANSLPLDYGTPHMSKAVVIMTDGENTMSSTVRSAYGYLSERRLGTNNGTNAVTELNQRLTAVCNALKSHGIKVYTIMFDLNNQSVENLFRNCASDPDYYFNSPTAEELSHAFRTIGDSLSNLRISK